MRVGLLIYGSLATVSGGYLYDRQLVNVLRGAGWQVDILSLPWRSYAAHLGDNLRIKWARQIAAAHYDVLLQDELNHPSLFLLNRAIRSASATPIVSIVHHLRTSEIHPRGLMPLYRPVERQYLHTVDAMICNSRTTLCTVHQLAKHSIPHIVAYPAADHLPLPSHAAVVSAIGTRLARSGPLQIIFVGNLIPRKGLHTLLNGLAQVQTRDWHLHVVGSDTTDANYSAAMRSLAGHLSLTSRITWHGRVSDAVLSALFGQADLLAMPSYEGFGIVFLEAMAHGVPVLAASVGAAPEIIHPGVNGELVPWDDDAAIAAKLRRLDDHRVQLANLAYHARLHFETHPNWATSMGNACDWLRENFA